jgi:hypothetical protein
VDSFLFQIDGRKVLVVGFGAQGADAHDVSRHLSNQPARFKARRRRVNNAPLSMSGANGLQTQNEFLQEWWERPVKHNRQNIPATGGSR